MLWVGVRYHGIALADIMQVMRVWLDQRPYQPKTFEYVISGSGTLVRVQFAYEAEVADFAQAFAGFVSRDRPTESGESFDTRESTTEYAVRKVAIMSEE